MMSGKLDTSRLMPSLPVESTLSTGTFLTLRRSPITPRLQALRLLRHPANVSCPPGVHARILMLRARDQCGAEKAYGMEANGRCVPASPRETRAPCMSPNPCESESATGLTPAVALGTKDQRKFGVLRTIVQHSQRRPRRCNSISRLSP